MQWFKKHHQFLRDESEAISSDSNYQEIFQIRDNLFLSHGEILVRREKLYRYPVLIVYKEATPYQLPSIYPLKRILTNEEVTTLAGKTYLQLHEDVRPYIEFYHQFRHQNQTGSLCILEEDNLESGGTFYGISTILARVRDWYTAHHTGNFPPESEEVAFFLHFTDTYDHMNLVYGEQFLTPDLVEGDFYAGYFTRTPSLSNMEHRTTYFGNFIDGITDSGIIASVATDLYRRMNDDRIKNSEDLINKKEVVQELIYKEQLIQGQWFHVTEEPKPFQHFRELVTIIGNGNYEEGVTRMVRTCSTSLAGLPDDFLLAIRFPNRKGKYEFQLFKVYKVEQPEGFLLIDDPRQKMEQTLQRYDRVEAIRTEFLSEETFHQRNGKRADYEIMRDASVNFFGVGAIGSEMADCMAKAGTGHLTLFDNQRIDIHNPVRHLTGIDMTDVPKVVAVAYHISKHNPFVQVIPIFSDLVYQDFEGIADTSLTISSIADDNVEGYINEKMVIAKRLTFYVRALRGGKAARIMRVLPGKDACFYCLQLYREEQNVFIDIPADPDFPTLRNECNNPIRPASAADLKLIASIASRLLIDHIQGKSSDINHWIWTTEAIPNTELQTPFYLYSQHISPHPGCPYCHHDKQMHVTLPAEKLSFMQQEVAANPAIETGGVLAGYITPDNEVIITSVSGPGPNAVRSAHRFEKDVAHCQAFLDDVYKESDGKCIYVGEWHSHPSKSNRPSGTDIKSLSDISLQKEYLTDHPVMIILSNTGEPSCTIHPAGQRYYFTEIMIKDETMKNC